MGIRSFALVGLMACSITGAYAKSVCKIKADIKIEKAFNRAYLWCLGNMDDNFEGEFETRRQFTFRDVTKEECDDLAKDMVGDTVTVKFLEGPPLGMVLLAPMEPMIYECVGTVEKIKKIKFKSKGKY
jgi:hypothetical protein